MIRYTHSKGDRLPKLNTDEEYDELSDNLGTYLTQSVDDIPKADGSVINPATTYGIIFSWERMDKEEWAVEHYKGVDDELLRSIYDEETLQEYGY